MQQVKKCGSLDGLSEINGIDFTVGRGRKRSFAWNELNEVSFPVCRTS
jgi:hypothetical protein